MDIDKIVRSAMGLGEPIRSTEEVKTVEQLDQFATLGTVKTKQKKSGKTNEVLAK